jgi:hypothetical protein
MIVLFKSSMNKLLFCFLISSSLIGQTPKIHLLIASDVKDAKYGVLTYGKIEKLNQLFNQVSKSLNYSIKSKYWFEENYQANIVVRYLKDSLLKIGPNDILVFYYLGRGENGLNNSTTELQFRNPKENLSVTAVNILLKNKGRLAMVIADCYEPFPKSRTAFLGNTNRETKLERETIQTDELDSLEAFARKRNLSKISENEYNSYQHIQDSLNKKMDNIVLNGQSEAFFSSKLLMILNRLSEYPIVGFPDNRKSLQRKFDILPDLSLKYISNRDFSSVIDSLYKKKSLLDFHDPMHIYLDTLLRIPLYDPEERPTTTTERFNDYVIRKVFFSNCGNTMVSNIKDNTSPHVDYTNSFYKNLSELMNLTDTKSINKLEIEDLLKPPKAEPIITISDKKCPAVSEKELFYLPKVIFSGREIESKFKTYNTTVDLLLKKKLKDEILDLFVENAKITIQEKSGKMVNLDLAKYLDLNNVSNLVIPVQRIERIQNFSKIKTILIVEP